MSDAYSKTETTVEIQISPTSVFKALFGASCLLTMLSLVSAFFRIYLNHQLRGAVWFFEVSGDTNVPTWYAAVTLLFCAFLLMIIGWVRQREQDHYANHWCLLSGLFLLLSIDEIATFHEWTANLVNVPDAGGFLYYSWVVVGLPFVGLLGLYYYRFIKSLPHPIKYLFLLAALIFVGGALGIEIINGKLEYTFGYESLAYTLVTALEEFCEMLGVAIFAYALLIYIERGIAGNMVQIRVKSKSHSVTLHN